MHTLPTLTYFSSFVTIPLQWVNALASDTMVGHDFTLPLSCSVYAYSICHKGTTPGATGIESGKAFDAGWTDTPVWIIAIGSK